MKKRTQRRISRILSILLVAVMLSQSTLGSGRIVLASPEERGEEEQVTDASTMTQESDSNPSLSETRGETSEEVIEESAEEEPEILFEVEEK